MLEQELKELKNTMLKSGVSPRYVRRTLKELQDHYSDIKTSLLSSGLDEKEAALQAQQQLGDLRTIADKAVSQKELRSFISMHPKMFFIMSPIVVYLVLAALGVLFVFASVEFFQLENLPHGTQVPFGFIVTFKITSLLYIYVLPLLVALVFVGLARERMLDNWIIYISLAVIAVLGSFHSTNIQGSVIGNGNFTISMGVGFGSLIRMSSYFATGWILNYFLEHRDRRSLIR